MSTGETMTTKKLTVVIPLFDDFESARELISLIGGVKKEQSVKFLLVDNGSKTNEIRELVDQAEQSNLSTIKCPSNLGFGGGIMFGVSDVTTSHVGWMPGNLKVTPADAISLWKKLLENPRYGAIKATRRRDSKIDFFKTLAAGLLASVFYRRNLLDSGGTPTLVETEFIKSIATITPLDYDFELFTMFAIRESRINLMRSPVNYGSRKFGSSHWQTSFRSEINLLRKLLSQQSRIRLLRKRRI